MISKVGTSLGVVIPASVCRELGFQRGDQMVIGVYGEGVMALRKLKEEEISALKPPIISYD